MDLKDKVVIITGASSGIGAALALQLSAAGAKLALAARREDKLQAVADQCPGSLAVRADVTSEADCKALIVQTVSAFGRIDIMINNAGMSMSALFEDITDVTLFERLMQVNYFGTVYCTYHALPHIKQTKGLLVAISSLTGKTGVPTRTAYAASKHAVQGLYDSLRIELLGTGVDVLVVSPGFVQSEVRVRGLGADGQPRGESHLDESAIMSAEDAAKEIVDAIRGRKRELLMSGKVRLGQWLRLIAPGMVDRIALKAVRDGQS